MSERWMLRGWMPQRRLVSLAFGLILLCCQARGASAQAGYGLTDSTGYDYFARDTDPRVAATVITVETYHLSDNSFWRNYRNGDYRYALSDLFFVLRYLPNHPRALHLIAYDKNLNRDPTVAIQLFERAIHLYPRSAYTIAQYGHYLCTLGQERSGIEFLNEALQIDPDLVVARAWRDEATQAPPTTAQGAPANRAAQGASEFPPPRDQ